MALLSQADHWGMLGSRTALYIQGAASEAYRRGSLGMIAGIRTRHVAERSNPHGRRARRQPADARHVEHHDLCRVEEDSNTTTLSTDGWSTAVTLKAGDVFEITDVYAVNPRTKQSTGQLSAVHHRFGRADQRECVERERKSR